MRKPNYNFERQERERIKAEKAKVKAQRKAEQAAEENAPPVEQDAADPPREPGR